MDRGEIFKAGSFRSQSSTLWRNNTNEIFSKSSREEDDEEALKWAALEKLPTYARLRKGILTTSQGRPSEIDVDNLGLKERRDLIERLIKTAEEDNERFLLKLRNRIERVGVELPTIEVRYEHLKIEADAYVGSRALPSFVNFLNSIVEIFFGFLPIFKSKKRQLTILDDVNGIIKPGRLTLLLGPPSSGKTTLLLALAGKLDSELKFSGRVTYNGHGMNEFVPRRTAAYISQYDVHIGEMTVRETLAFSARCQGVGSRYDMLAELSRREKEANIKPDPDIDVYMKAVATEGQETNVVTDYVLKILGLDICADTMVGDEMLRGISGGQRKRVTTGEMLVGPAGVLFMDEISTGLDSSTTYQIVNCLKQYVHIFNGTNVISLLQPAPETYDLFDDIILLSDGQIVYQGPREYVLDFFESMGFKCPERKGVADFLQEVTSKKDQAQYWARKEEPYRFITVKEFAEAFQSFHVGQKLGDELVTGFDKSKSHPAALTTKEYGVKTKELIKASFSREWLLMNRNSFVYMFKIVQLCIMALVSATLFLRTEMHHRNIDDGNIYVGSLFFAVITIMFNGMSELSMTIAKLPVFYKQRDLHFYPAWAYGLPSWILKIPISVLEAIVWVAITYYTTGLDPSVARFFKQLLVLFLINQMASSLFRAIAAIARNNIIANTYGSFVLLMLFTLGGFVLSREDIKDWWIWGYWCSPLMYGQTAVLVNEFLGKKWRHRVAGSTEPLGIEVLKGRGFFYESKWYWIGTGALIGFILVLNLLYTLALTWLNAFDKVRAVAKTEDPQSDGAIELQDSSSHQGQAGESENRKKGMILPFEPHSIVFDNIVYAVDMPP
ncbi:pleiotropic drug resistance protein 1, partial [Morus notabilis]